MISIESLTLAGNPLPQTALLYFDLGLSHLDLGSNVGATLKGLDKNNITCVEAYLPAAEKLIAQGFTTVQGSALTVLSNTTQVWGRVTALDFIEHLSKEEGLRLLDYIDEMSPDEVIFFVPVETDTLVASSDYKNFMSKIFSTIPLDQQDLQSHKSRWAVEDFTSRGYRVFYYQNFHMQGFDAFFAVRYTKPEALETVLSRVQNYSSVKRLLMPPSSHIAVNSDIRGADRIFIGENVNVSSGARIETISNYRNTFYYTPYLIIEDCTTIERDVHLGSAEYLRIGENVMIAGRVTIIDHDHDYHDVSTPPMKQKLVSSPIEIDDDCLIYENVVILKGVHIGKHCVIGANSKVITDIPSFCKVVGDPAIIIEQYQGNSWVRIDNDHPVIPDNINNTNASVDIIIPVYNNLALTKSCLAALAQTTKGFTTNIIVIDNGSTDGTLEYLVKQPVNLIHNPSNQPYSVSINQGIRTSSGDYIIALNNDTVPTNNWLKELIYVMRRFPNAGIIGPVSNYGAGWQTVSYNEIDAQKRHGQTLPSNRVVGFCMCIDKALIRDIGGFDTIFTRGNYEDDDYCYRALLLGYSPRIALGSFVYHKGHATFKSEGINLGDALEASWIEFKKKWGIPMETKRGEPYGILVPPTLKLPL